MIGPSEVRCDIHQRSVFTLLRTREHFTVLTSYSRAQATRELLMSTSCSRASPEHKLFASYSRAQAIRELLTSTSFPRATHEHKLLASYSRAQAARELLTHDATHIFGDHHQNALCSSTDDLHMIHYYSPHTL